MNRIIHQVWLGEKMPEEFARWRQRLIELNPTAEHRLWTETDMSGLDLDIRALKKDYLGWAGVSNVVRLKAVLDHGGIYLDCDVEPLKPLDPLFDLKAFAARQDTDRLCNAVFGAEQGSEWVRWQYDRHHYNIGVPPYWGVELMSTAPRTDLTVIPTEWCYPFHWEAPPEARVPHADSLMVHHWEGSWG